MRLRFRSFDWDEHNRDHIAVHGLTAEKVEEAAQRGLMILKKTMRRGEIRHVAVGRLNDGRMVMIVYTLRNEICRVVTAHILNRQLRKKYAQDFKD